MIQSSDGSIWTAQQTGNVDRVVNVGGSPTVAQTFHFTSLSWFGLANGGDGSVFVDSFYAQEVTQYVKSGTTWEQEDVYTFTTGRQPTAMVSTPRGSIWVGICTTGGGGGGVLQLKYVVGTWENPTPHWVVGQYITLGSAPLSMTLAPNGNIWILLRSWKIKELESVDGTAYIGTTISEPSTIFYYPEAITASKDGTLWVSSSGFITQLKKTGGSWKVAGRVTNPEGTSTDLVTAPDGTIWSASGYNEVEPVVHGANGWTLGVSVDETSNSPAIILFDNTTNLWYSSSSGLMRIRAPDPQTASLKSMSLIGGLSSPVGVTTDSHGNIYVADEDNSRVLKITPSGTESTVGTGLDKPEGVAVDKQGNVFIANTYAGNIIEVTQKGTQIVVASTLTYPTSVAPDNQGDLFISNFVASKIEETSLTKGTWKTPITIGAIGDPEQIAYAQDGTLYIASVVPSDGKPGNEIAKLHDNSGTWALQTLTTTVNNPRGVAVAPDGSVYAMDSGNNRLLHLTTVDGTWVQSIDSTYTFSNSYGQEIWVDSAANIYLANSRDSTIDAIASGGGHRSSGGSRSDCLFWCSD